jgi:hypothetical protein
MKPSMGDLILASIIGLFIVLVDGGALLLILSTSTGDAFLQHVLQDVGAAMVAASPFVFVYQFLG